MKKKQYRDLIRSDNGVTKNHNRPSLNAQSNPNCSEDGNFIFFQTKIKYILSPIRTFIVSDYGTTSFGLLDKSMKNIFWLRLH